MGSPKHLWSGDWETHSRPTPAAPDPFSAPAREAAPTPAAPANRSPRRGLVIGSGVLVVLVIVGVVLAATLGHSSRPATAPQAAVLPQSGAGSGGQGIVPAPTATTPPVSAAPVTVGPLFNWLGMSLSDSSGGPTVATVSQGSGADTAGVDPGDVITAVAGQPINSVAQLRSALAKLPLGHPFQFTVDRGSTAVTLTATLANRPIKVS